MPVPAELRGGRVKLVATLESADALQPKILAIAKDGSRQILPDADPPFPLMDPNVVMRAFKADYASGKFAGLEGQYAAYVNAVLVKVGPNNKILHAEIVRDFPKTDIVIQPIRPVQTYRMPSPREPRIRGSL